VSDAPATEGPWKKYQQAAPAAEGPWTKYQQQAPSQPKAEPGIIDKAMGYVPDLGKMMGMPSALERSAQISAERPYKPGMTAGQMIAGRPSALSDPMLYAAGPGNIGGPRVPVPPAQAAITQRVTQAIPTARPPAPPSPSVASIVGAPLSNALATGDNAAVDRYIAGKFRSAVKPSRIGQQSAPDLAAQDRRIMTTVDQIIANKPNLQLTDNAGNTITGQLPRTLRQFSEALDQTKKSLFQRYDQMKTAAGPIQIDLAPVVSKLREIAGTPEVVDVHPGLGAEAERLATNFESRGHYTPSETQDVIQNLNRVLAAFWKNPTQETVGRSGLLAPVAQVLRSQLDKAIEAARGPGYQELRNQYGALKSVEKDVAGAVQRNANKIPGGIGEVFANLGATEELLRGVVTVNPEAIARAGGIKAAQLALQYIHNPNRAIMRIFQHRERQGQPSGLSAVSPLGLAATREAAGLSQDRQKPRRGAYLQFDVSPPPGPR
jgi:hypothetical protein